MINVKMVDFGRLKSPLPDSEIVLKMIRELKLFYTAKVRERQHASNNDIKNQLVHITAELNEVEDVSEKAKVLIIRLIESVNNVEKTLNSYRRKLKKTQKKNPNARQYLKVVESYLGQVRTIKRTIRDESRRSTQEEKWVHDAAA